MSEDGQTVLGFQNRLYHGFVQPEPFRTADRNVDLRQIAAIQCTVAAPQRRQRMASPKSGKFPVATGVFFAAVNRHGQTSFFGNC